jgi:membrane protease YdiL (CAAX protease family)
LNASRTQASAWKQVNPIPPFAKPAKDGAPARARTEPQSELLEWYHPVGAPSIVGTTDTKHTRVGHPPDEKSLWPLGIFFLLSAITAWIVWLWPVDRQGWLNVILFGSKFKFPLMLVKLVIGNCLPGILAVVWTLSEGKDQFRGMLSTLTRWRTSLKWYVLAVALPCGVSLVALDVVLLYFPKAHSFPPVIDFFKVLLMTLPLGPLWEELAWRAFALRKLESRYSRLVSALLLGAYWAV